MRDGSDVTRGCRLPCVFCAALSACKLSFVRHRRCSAPTRNAVNPRAPLQGARIISACGRKREGEVLPRMNRAESHGAAGGTTAAPAAAASVVATSSGVCHSGRDHNQCASTLPIASAARLPPRRAQATPATTSICHTASRMLLSTRPCTAGTGKRCTAPGIASPFSACAVRSHASRPCFSGSAAARPCEGGVRLPPMIPRSGVDQLTNCPRARAAVVNLLPAPPACLQRGLCGEPGSGRAAAASALPAGGKCAGALGG